ncbi:MAG: NAD-binding protein [Rickettsiaceae bacterium H1]|nr:NAD-binding protein [Rickettsiaceae bacterium H1]
MQVLICGAGNIGKHFIDYFIKQEYDVLVIDRLQNVINKINKFFDVQTALGDVSTTEIFTELSLNEVEIVLAVTGDDNVNLIASKISSIFFPNAKRIIRLGNVRRKKNDDFHQEMAVDFAFFPKQEIADFLYNSILQSVPIPEKDFRLSITKERQNDNLLGIIREDDFFTSVNEYEQGDLLISISNDKKNSFYGNVIIIGGSKISTILAKKLEAINSKIGIVEQNYDLAKELAIIFPKIEVTNGSPIDKDILVEAGLDENITVVTTTENDQINLISLLLAHNLGCKNTVGIVNTHVSYIEIAKSFGISQFQSLGTVFAAFVVNFVNIDYIKKLHTVNSFDFFLIKIISKDVLSKIREINAIKLGIIRNNNFFLPDAIDLSLQDELIVLTQEVNFTKNFV